MRQSSQTGNQISQSYQYDLCLAFCKNLFTLHLSSQIPCVYRHFGRWRVISNSSPTLHLDSKSIGRCVSSFMRWCVEVYGWRVGEELLRTLHPCNRPVYRYSGGFGEEWRVFPCLLLLFYILSLEICVNSMMKRVLINWHQDFGIIWQTLLI